MDSSSSLYMCFPCYQLFSSLEEVLSHQLTCHPDDTGEEATPTAPPGPQTESDALYQYVRPTPDPQCPVDPPQQKSTQSGPASAPQNRPSPVKPSGPPRQSPSKGTQRQPTPSSAPLIRYQCGDCSSLFQSLAQWQQHRKLGQCTRSRSESEGEGAGKGEGQAVTGIAEVEVKTEEQLEQGGETQPGKSEGSKVEGAREDKGIDEGGASVKTGEWQRDCTERERAVSQDHSYLTCTQGQEEDDEPAEQATGVEAMAGQTQESAEVGLTVAEAGTTAVQLGSEAELMDPQGTRAPAEGQTSGKGESSAVHVASDQSFLCVCCGSGFSSEPALVTHRRTRHGLEEALHCCPVCGERFMNTTLFLYHRRQHREKEEGQRAAASPGNPSRGAKRVLGLLSATPSVGTKRKCDLGPSPSLKGQPGPAAAGRCEAGRVGAGEEGGDTGATVTPEAGGEAGPKGPAASHACPHCGRAFKRRCHLLTHIYSHTGKKRYSCETCNKAFTYKSNLARHRHTHARSKPYSCQRCGKTFTQSGTLKQHWLIHAKADALSRGAAEGGGDGADGKGVVFQLPHPCTDCSSSFKTRTQLLIHRHVHTGQYPFSCTICGQSFLRRKQLQLHSLKHQGKEPISCLRCSTQFLSQSLLDDHLQRCLGKVGRGRGRGVGQLECDMCGHRCATQEGLDLHRLSHSGQTPLRCPLAPCRRRFATSAALEEHVLAHCQSPADPNNKGPAPKPRPFHCEHCGKDFTTASSLSVHLRIHTGERPYQCTQCGKRFRQIPHLRDHERLHSGARPFSCSVCGKSFVLAARLAEHARTHSGDKPYSCPLCPRAFRSLSNLGKHRKTHGRGPLAKGPGSEGEAAIRTILLVQAMTPSLEGEVQTVSTSPSSSQLLLLHPSMSMGDGQEGEVMPILQHAFQVIVEETI